MALNYTDEQINQAISYYFNGSKNPSQQYVGPRIVPILGRKGDADFEWSGNYDYEPLTIVKKAGDTYVSRQYVPAGTPIDNTSFWAHFPTFNAQVEQYRAEVRAYDARIRKLEGYVPAAAISLSAIGGKPNDETFDNAKVINEYFARNVGMSLYVPNGEWFIKSTINCHDFDIVCAGVFVPTADFVATLDYDFINNDYLIGGTKYLPVFSTMVENEQNVSWNVKWAKRRHWVINVNLKNVTGKIGFLGAGLFCCSVEVNGESVGSNICFGTNVRCVESYIKVNSRADSRTNRSPVGVFIRTPDCILESIVVGDAIIGLSVTDSVTINNAHIIDCDTCVRYSNGGVRFGYMYADHCNCVFKPIGYDGSAYLSVGMLYLFANNEYPRPFLLDNAIGTVNIGCVSYLNYDNEKFVNSIFVHDPVTTHDNKVFIGTLANNGTINVTNLTETKNIQYWPYIDTAYSFVFSNTTTIDAIKQYFKLLGIPDAVCQAIFTAFNTCITRTRTYTGEIMNVTVEKTSNLSTRYEYSTKYSATMPGAYVKIGAATD